MKNERLPALCMLSVEKSVIAGIADFNEKVIDHFASAKNRRVTFVYKQILLEMVKLKQYVWSLHFLIVFA